MSSYNTPANVFTDVDIDWEAVEKFLVNEPPSPATTITNDSDWLDAIPIHQPSPAPATVAADTPVATYPDAPVWQFHTPGPPADNLAGESTPIAATPMTAASGTPQQEEEDTSPLSWMMVTQAIDFKHTVMSHEGMAHMSIEAEGPLPRTVQERWENFRECDTDDLYRRIFYFKHFYGDYFLSDWQKLFLSDYSKIAPPHCYFCNLPRGYWCDEVATRLQFRCND